jgi:integrase
MARDNGPTAKIQRARERLSDDHHDAIRDWSRAIDPNTPQNGPTKSARTVETYTDNARRFQDRLDQPLLDATTDDVLDGFSQLAEEGSQSVAQYQSAVKSFYRYHDTHTVDVDAIAVSTGSDPGIDEQTILTPEEFHSIREAADNPRNRCIVDLFGYTGQRIRVIQTLRVQDVDPSAGATGAYWLNNDADGLKGAEKAMQKRPLLGARRSVMDWLDYHPTGDPDDHLITVMPSAGRGTPGDIVAQNTIRRSIKHAADRAGIDKPVNPHAFRHFFATTAKREYDMDDETIRRLLGHGANSRIMETTYRHLSDDDIVTSAEASFGADVDDDQTLTPPTCPTCGVPLRPGLDSCPTVTCNEVFAPGASPQSGLATDLKQLDDDQLDELFAQLRSS